MICMMPSNVRILEGKSLLWDEITTQYKNKVLGEDYIVMHSMDYDRFKVLSTTKPFFSEYYIVELHLSHVTTKTINQIKKYLQCGWICFIFVCTVKDDYEAVGVLNTQNFNGYKITYKYWKTYVTRRLQDEVRVNLENVYKALGGRFELTDIVIDMINKNAGRVTMRAITQLIGKKDIMSIDMMWFAILKKDNKKKRDVFKFLEEYRYGYTFISEALSRKYEEAMTLYKDFMKGKINSGMLREYKKESRESTWKLTTYLEIFSVVSFEELLLIGEVIQCSNINNSTKMFMLVGELYSRDSINCGVI